MSKVYDYDDLKQNTSEKKCWVVAFGRIHNITNFLVEHPGGMDILLSNAGKDITAEFLARGHTRFAYSQLTAYEIGIYDYSKDPEEFITRPIAKKLQRKLRVITQKELEEHNTQQSCWIMIDGNIYDVTLWLIEHPGGQNYLLNLAGKDATQQFKQINHSGRAMRLLKALQIGVYQQNEEKLRSLQQNLELTTEELEKHNKPDDCWVLINNRVYDITDYLQEHPGGSQAILEQSGAIDASKAFKEQGHSKFAQKILENHFIGEIKTKQKNKPFVDFKQLIILLIGVLVALILYKFYM